MDSELRSFNESRRICEVETGQSMVIIHSQEEQDIIANLTANLVDNVWIGLIRGGKNFTWTDKSEFNYENWAEHQPSNDPHADCVQMYVKQSEKHKWDDEDCTKRNLIICQKIPDLAMKYLKDVLLDTKNIELNAEKELNKRGIKKMDTSVIYIVIDTPIFDHSMIQMAKRKLS
jgi:hypothetical protein